MTYDAVMRSGVAIGLVALASLVFAQQSPMQVEGANTVTPEVAKVLWDSGAKFIDVRTPDLWEGGAYLGLFALSCSPNSPKQRCRTLSKRTKKWSSTAGARVKASI